LHRRPREKLEATEVGLLRKIDAMEKDERPDPTRNVGGLLGQFGAGSAGLVFNWFMFGPSRLAYAASGKFPYCPFNQ
jgi:hypothetical protein